MQMARHDANEVCSAAEPFRLLKCSMLSSQPAAKEDDATVAHRKGACMYSTARYMFIASRCIFSIFAWRLRRAQSRACLLDCLYDINYDVIAITTAII